MRLELGLGLLKKQKKPQYYLEFDGADDYADGGVSSFQLGMDNFILGFIINIPTRNGKTGYGYIIIKGNLKYRVYYSDGNEDTFNAYFLQDGANSSVITLDYGKSYFIISQRYDATDNDLNHCNIVQKIYNYDTDTILLSSIKENYDRVNNDTSNLYIATKSTYYFYLGYLDNIFTSKGSDYDDVVSDTLIRNLAGSSPKNAKDPQKVLTSVNDYFPISKGSGITMYEKINGNDATLKNGVLWMKW